MEKQEQRILAKNYLLGLSSEEKIKISQRLKKILMQQASWQKAKVIAITKAMEHEIPTDIIIMAAWQANKKIVIPKTFAQRKMAFYEYQPNDELIKTSFGVLEPSKTAKMIPKKQIDLIIVPGLKFELNNNYRLGYGGGFYDLYLQDYQGMTISLATRQMVTNTATWSIDNFDQPVKKILVIDTET